MKIKINTMKIKSLFIVALSALFATACSNDSLKVNGNINGMPDGQIVVSVIENNRPVAIDTVDIKEGKFTVETKLEKENFILFTDISNPRNGFNIFVFNETVEVNGDYSDFRAFEVTGSERNDLYKSLIDDLTEQNNTLRELSMQAQQANQAKDTLKLDSVLEAMDAGRKVFENVVYDFAAANPSSTLTPWAIISVLQGPSFDIERVKPLFDALSDEAKESEFGKQLAERVEIESKFSVGATPPDFTLTTLKGEEFTLSAQKGKVILIDFWASWCGPCRQENPNNVKLYAKYQQDGFDIAAVSVDRESDTDKWKKAIEDDGLEYTQMLDVKEVAKSYNVTSIPTTLLLDKEGKIIAKNLRGEKLTEKLAEIFGR
jgi:thiol-disulfide isomerase/thioredoxin